MSRSVLILFASLIWVEAAWADPSTLLDTHSGAWLDAAADATPSDPRAIIEATPETRGLQLFQNIFGVEQALRGDLEFIFLAEEDRVEIEIRKQDFNWFEGPDEFTFTVIDAFDRPVFQGSIPDDGDVSASNRIGPVQRETFEIDLPAPGIYRLIARGDRDMRYQVIPGAAYWGAQSSLELYDPGQSLNLYFIAPPNEFLIDLFTRHFAGLYQLISIHDSNDRMIDSVYVNRLDERYALRATPSLEERGRVWRMRVIMQDMVIRAEGFSHFHFSPEAAYDFAFWDGLLQPRSLRMTAAPGEYAPFRFKVENTRGEPLHARVAAIPMGGADIDLLVPAEVEVAAVSHAYFWARARFPESAAPGEEAAFTVSLVDENGVALSRSLAETRLAEPPPLSDPLDWVFFTPQRLDLVRERGRSGDAALRGIYGSVLRHAQAIVDDNLPILEEKGGWVGRYICDGLGGESELPEHLVGASLIFNPKRPGFHICSVDGVRYFGERYEEGWRGRYHQNLGSRLRPLGFAYALEENPAFALFAREMLMDYADRYHSWPLVGYQGNPTPIAARLHVETLMESIWLIDAMIGYALTRGDLAYSPADRLHIEENLIRAAAEVIQGNPRVDNWQSWHVTAVGLAGYILRDDEMVEWALRGPHGLIPLLDSALRDDGLWFEGSLGYHFFGISPIHLLLGAAMTHGENLYTERLRLAHSSALDLAFPDGRFPDLNDSMGQNLLTRRVLYEYANARFGDEMFSRALTFIYDRMGVPRSDYESLFFGEEYERNPLEPGSALKDRMGLSILRAGHDLDAPVALMDYGPHGLSHGHYDKLHVSLFGAGAEWLQDIGIGSRNIRAFNSWFRASIGHNTVMLGERNQGEDSEAEREIAFYDASLSRWQAMRAGFGAPVYPAGSFVERAAILADNRYLIFIDNVRGGPAPYDFVFHARGDWWSSFEFTPGNAPAHWRTAVTGHDFLRAPRRFNEVPATDVLHRRDIDAVQVEARKQYGFSDDCETVDQWSGNISLSSDALEGRHSIQWVVVPTEIQSFGKEFIQLDEDAPLPDRLTFDYKLEAATFDHFILRLEGAIPGMRTEYLIDSGTEAETGVWRRAEIDLLAPSSAVESKRRAQGVTFLLSGAIQSDRAFRVWVDAIRAYRGENFLPGETRGLRLSFPGGDATDYYLASGPSAGPPREHPVLIARRPQGGSARHVAVAEPFWPSPEIRSIEWRGESALRIDRGGHFDEIDFDVVQDAYRFVQRAQDESLRSAAMIGMSRLELPEMLYESDAPSSAWFGVRALGEVSRILYYEKPHPNADALALALEETPLEVRLDGVSYGDYQLTDQPFPLTLRFENMPAGAHRIEALFEESTGVPSWRKHGP